MLWTAGVLQSLFFSSPKPPSLLHNCSGIPLELVLTKQFKTKPIKQIHSGWSHTNEFQTMISRREERQLTHQNKIEPRGHIFWTAHWRLCVLMVLCTLQNNETKKNMRDKTSLMVFLKIQSFWYLNFSLPSLQIKLYPLSRWNS